ncbi:MAG: hypothetical protein RLZ25_31 [Pseudomonadota bacterium]|jgi:uncharacterized flavoprotein (TIGR03862 family)
MTDPISSQIAIVGGGPSGLMAAEMAAAEGLRVDLFDAMPSVGRKFLLAGKGGLNLTHAEPFELFIDRYGDKKARLEPLLREFGPESLREWAHDLGTETFIGSSQRVFPTAMKAAPLLRAWIRRLKEKGVHFHTRHRWEGWTPEGYLLMSTPSGTRKIMATATVLALGGASWPHLGSDGGWVPHLEDKSIPITPLEASNSGFRRTWSKAFIDRFAGTPIKTVACKVKGQDAQTPVRGELMVTERGLEGGLVYALSAALRAQIKSHGSVELVIDLSPDRSLERLEKDLSEKRGKSSLSTHLRKNAGLSEVKIALLREGQSLLLADRLAATIKALPITLDATFPIAEAISSAGGVAFEALDEHLMVIQHPGLFIAGEMLDWDAPTGGYLLTASFATGRKAGLSATRWIVGKSSPKTVL